jgi:uncharacterized protein (TIGR02996 family)
MSAAMHSDREAFVQEIVAYPDDDAPRLVYADWLEEHDDPQGEFIRAECELAQSATNSGRKRELRQIQRRLLVMYGEAWIRAVSPAIRWSTFRRGLLEQAIIDGKAFVHEGGQALRLAPVFELGTCLETEEEVAALAAIPELGQLRKLRLGDSALGDNGMRRLVQSGNFPAAKALWLTRCRLGPAGIRALADCAALAGLERLVLSGNPLGDEGAQTVAESPTFANLRRLTMDDCEIGDAGIRALAQSPTLKLAQGKPTVGVRQH